MLNDPPSDESYRPIPDAHPLKEGEQYAQQKSVLDRLEKRVLSFKDGQEARPPRDPEGRPWTPIEDAPRNQVLMLDGGRGTGKTSLMLTLMQRWRRRDEKDLLVLDRIDFDPMPPDMSPYAWIALALRPWVEALDDGSAAKCNGDRFEWTTHPERTASLTKRWKRFHKRVVLGWNETPKPDDIDEFVAARLSGQSGWSQLERSWRHLIDALLPALERRNWLAPRGVLIIPIDDLDLAPSCARSALLAVRNLRHPRVVFLLSGDCEHLKKVIALQQFKAEKDVGCPTGEEAKIQRRTANLAHDLMRKVIPEGNRVEVRWMSTQEAFKFAMDRLEPGIAPEAFFDRALADEDETGKLAKAVHALWKDGLADLEGTFRVRHLHQSTVGASSASKVFEKVLACAEDQATLEPLLESRGSLRAGLRLEPFGGLVRGIGVAHGFRIVSPTTERVASIVERMAALRPNAWTSPEPTDWSTFVYSEFQLPWRQTAVRLPWPEPMPRDVTAAYVLIDRLTPAVKAGTADGRFYAWLRQRLKALDPSLDDAELEQPLTVVQSRGNNAVAEWATNLLPVLCAPGFGLSPATGHAVLIAVRTRFGRTQSAWSGQVANLIAMWRTQLANALGLDPAQGAKARGGGSISLLVDDEQEQPLDRGIGALRTVPSAWHRLGQYTGNESWYDTPLPDGSTVLTTLSQVDKLEDDVSLADLLQITGVESKRPNWASEQIAAQPHYAKAAIDAVSESHQIHGDRFPLRYAVNLWRALAQAAGRNDVADYFTVADDELGLNVAAPAMELQPTYETAVQLSDPSAEVRTITEWIAKDDRGEPLPSVLAGCLGFMQSVDARASRPTDFLAIEPVEMLSVEGKEVPSLDVRTWWVADSIRAAWRQYADGLAGLSKTSQPQTILNGAYAAWVAVGSCILLDHEGWTDDDVTLPITPDKLGKLLGCRYPDNSTLRHYYDSAYLTWLKAFGTPQLSSVLEKAWVQSLARATSDFEQSLSLNSSNLKVDPLGYIERDRLWQLLGKSSADVSRFRAYVRSSRENRLIAEFIESPPPGLSASAVERLRDKVIRMSPEGLVKDLKTRLHTLRTMPIDKLDNLLNSDEVAKLLAAHLQQYQEANVEELLEKIRRKEIGGVATATHKNLSERVEARRTKERASEE